MFDMQMMGTPMGMPNQGPPLAVQFDPMSGRFFMADANGQSFLLDNGPGNVHIDGPLATFAQGYPLTAKYCIADRVMPAGTPVAKQSDKYWKHALDDFLNIAPQTVVAAGANPPEVSPRQSQDSYQCIPRGMATFLPTQVQANSDAALMLAQRYLQLPLYLLTLMREVRVATAVRDSTKYAAFNYLDLTATPTAKWNGGSTSDPIKNLLDYNRRSILPITHIVMSPDSYDSMVQNAAVQKYFAFKSNAKAKPSDFEAKDLSAILSLPEIVIGHQKWFNPATQTIEYIWGNDVVGFHMPETVDGLGVPVPWRTFRWAGGSQPGVNQAEMSGMGTMTFVNGFGVRSFFDFTRGTQGGNKVIAYHEDAEQIIDTRIAYLIKGAYQP
jgi:hypothetical protein